MKHGRLLAAGVVLAMAGAAIWVSGTKMRTTGTAADEEKADAAYDYNARDVVVRQMGPDGVLQYEIHAKQITQEPRNGQISAQELVMYHDPAGSEPGGAGRWTITADRADLPEAGDQITVQGNVIAEGRPQNARSGISLRTVELTFNLETQDLFTSKPVKFSWGDLRLDCGDFRLNIKRRTVDLESSCHGTN